MSLPTSSKLDPRMNEHEEESQEGHVETGTILGKRSFKSRSFSGGEDNLGSAKDHDESSPILGSANRQLSPEVDQ
jgi:hypothetical protein